MRNIGTFWHVFSALTTPMLANAVNVTTKAPELHHSTPRQHFNRPYRLLTNIRNGKQLLLTRVELTDIPKELTMTYAVCRVPFGSDFCQRHWISGCSQLGGMHMEFMEVLIIELVS